MGKFWDSYTNRINVAGAIRRGQKKAEFDALEREIHDPIVIVYRRRDGSEASVTTTGLYYADQLERIEERGYTILNVIK